jgi:hypothetical protein
LFKQCRNLYGHKPDSEERIKMRPVMVHNIVETMQRLLEVCVAEALELKNAEAMETIQNFSIAGDMNRVDSEVFLFLFFHRLVFISIASVFNRRGICLLN